MLWSRLRRRFRHGREERHEELLSDLESDAGVVEDIAQDIEAVLENRRKRLRLKLGKSLRIFRAEVLDEMESQRSAVRDRQTRLKRRQSDILDSLAALREDIVEEIEETLLGVQKGGERVEKGLNRLRSDWEQELNILISEARADVDFAVQDIEEAISDQREEWRQAVDVFNKQYTQQERFALNVTTSDLFKRSEIDLRLSEIQSSISAISADVEAEIAEFKQRWTVTTARVKGLPKELPRLRSLSDVRAYVADTIFAGDTPQLVQRSRRRKLANAQDPLGVRYDIGKSSDAWLRPTTESNLRLANRQITIVTTAALPWMTGTSVNPLLRAAHLAAKGYNVSLLLPFLPPSEQTSLFPSGLVFERPAQQEQYSRWWLETRANMKVPQLRMRWYPAEYCPFLGAIIQKGVDLAQLVPESERDVVVLEEPEHINWYHHGARWTSLYSHVVGVAHTNYLQYARFNNEGAVPGSVKEKWTQLMNNLVCAAYTDVVVKLSATLQDVPGNNLVCNVHGVRSEFLAIGAAAAQAEDLDSTFSSGAYFLGKSLWTKGYRELFDALQMGSTNATDIHTYGSGPDSEAINAAVFEKKLPIIVHDAIDHAHPTLHGYRLFVNPSTSDVLCTATAEALAMGKKVLIPDHPSNIFFKQFSNTITYDDPSELKSLMNEALETPPLPMSPMEQYALSWEAATERLLDAAALPAGSRRPKEKLMPQLAYYTHFAMGVQPVFDVFRTVTGAGPEVPWDQRFAMSWRGSRVLTRKVQRQGRRLLPRQLPERSAVSSPGEEAQAHGRIEAD